uniref:Uncharacterized protein n=1 Tax=Vespula pensylvanica TaxID=30213 RepID=A0A834U577_VESPE|nr:hypothetical protein H0235_011607 [Vespula pensylvanica]
MKKQKSRDFLPSNRRTDMDARSSFQQRQRQRQHKEKITALFRSFDKGQGLWFICESHVGQEVFNGAVLKCRSHGHIQSTEPNSTNSQKFVVLEMRFVHPNGNQLYISTDVRHYAKADYDNSSTSTVGALLCEAMCIREYTLPVRLVSHLSLNVTKSVFEFGNVVRFVTV